MEILLILTITFLAISSAINFLYAFKKRKEVARFNKINNAIYNEYKKVGGREWAEKSIKEIIHKVVKSVDESKITRRIYI